MRSMSTGAGELTTNVERSKLTRASGLATEVGVELAAASELTGATTVVVAAETTMGSERTGTSGSEAELEAERAAGPELTGAGRSVTGVEVESMVVSLACVISGGMTIDVMSLGDVSPVKFRETE